MIVKNEKDYLNDCLKFISEWVDEIIIVDTGSIDCTKEIALQYTRQVYEYKFNDDFSAALNFAKLLTRSKPYTKKIINNYNILSIKKNGTIFECTSSWFSWSNNSPCAIACDYCIIQKIDYLLTNRKIGCAPWELLTETKLNQSFDIGEISVGTSIEGNVNEQYLSYDNLRTVQECRANIYN